MLFRTSISVAAAFSMFVTDTSCQQLAAIQLQLLSCSMPVNELRHKSHTAETAKPQR